MIKLYFSTSGQTFWSENMSTMSRILALIKYLTELRELIANIAIVSTHIYPHTIAALVQYQIQCNVKYSCFNTKRLPQSQEF